MSYYRTSHETQVIATGEDMVDRETGEVVRPRVAFSNTRDIVQPDDSETGEQPLLRLVAKIKRSRFKVFNGI